MRSKKFEGRIVPFLLAFATASPASAEWRRVDSPNFVVVGDSSVRSLRGIATRFELFHESLRRVLGAATTTPAVPTVVVVFASDEAFTPYKPVYRGRARAVGGYAASGNDVNYIVMRDAGDSNDRLIFHEYTHTVVANAVARAPVWFNEGLAEFYSTFAVTDGGRRVQIGRPIVEHLALLHGSTRVPLHELLKVDPASPLYNENDVAGIFYAESWALTHMLISAEPSHVPQLAEYLRRVNDGADEIEAWDQVLGTARTENELRRYLTRPIFNTAVIDFPEKVEKVAIAEVPVSAADTAALLALLQLRRAGAGAAAKLLEPALKQEPSNPLANAIMAQVELSRNDGLAAAKRLMALERPSDWFAAYRIALSLTQAIDLERDMKDGRAVVERVTGLLEQVDHTHSALPNVLASLARVELYGDAMPSPAARDNIARARTLAPGRIDYALLQAQIFAEGRDFVRARAVVGPLMTPSYPESVRNSARKLMAGLVDLEKALTAPARASTTGTRSIEVPDGEADRPRTTGRAGRFVPAYRPLLAGEQRLDGMLERIDCRVKAGRVYCPLGGRDGPA